MVPGLNTFREWFDGYHGRHVIIGGTACKLCSLFGPGERIELPDSVREEVAHFVEARPWDDNMLKVWHLPIDSQGMADLIGSIYL